MNAAKHIMLVGATGLVGRALLPQLIAKEYSVVALVRNMKALPSGVRGVQVDLADAASLKACAGLGDIDTLIYSAYSTSADASYDRRVNLEALKELVELVKPKHVVYLSTVGVFATGAGEGAFDENSPREAYSAYERDKLDAERFLQGLDNRVTILNLSIVYDKHSPRLNEYQRLLGLGYFIYKRSGGGFYNVVHASDVADAVVRVVESERQGSGSFIVNAETIVFRDWVALLERHFGYARRPKLPAFLAPLLRGPLRRVVSALGLRAPMRVSEPKATLFEQQITFRSDKIRRELGWLPRVKAAELLQ